MSFETDKLTELERGFLYAERERLIQAAGRIALK
jgi:hypothetical protein